MERAQKVITYSQISVVFGPWPARLRRLAKTAFVAGGIFYGAICAVLYFYQEKLLFFPQVLPPEYVFNFRGIVSEIMLPVRGAKVDALLFRASHPKGVVLYFHGNAGNLAGWGW